MRVLFLIQVFLFAQGIAGQPQKVDVSACHVFIDHQYIWTLEVKLDENNKPVPILNSVTLGEGEWDLRPDQLHLVNSRHKEARIEKFSIDTGVAGEPYIVRYLKVLGDSFIGLDLIGDFQDFSELSEVSIELGDNLFILAPVDCLDFESIAHQINQINFDSPDIRQDYEVLKIELIGKREARRRFF